MPFDVLIQGGIPRVADFVHGKNGLGEVSVPLPSRKKCEKSAAEFLVEKVSEYPGEVTILALGPLTNLAIVRILKSLSLIIKLSLCVCHRDGLFWF